MKKSLALAGMIALALFASACTPEQRCKFYERLHADKIAEANGDQKKIDLANIVYAPLKAACAAQGIVIN